MKKCPFCAEEIREEAIKCRYCSSDLQQPITKNEVKTRKCPFCAEVISIESIKCPYCVSELTDISLKPNIIKPSQQQVTISQKTTDDKGKNPWLAGLLNIFFQGIGFSYLGGGKETSLIVGGILYFIVTSVIIIAALQPYRFPYDTVLFCVLVLAAALISGWLAFSFAKILNQR